MKPVAAIPIKSVGIDRSLRNRVLDLTRWTHQVEPTMNDVDACFMMKSALDIPKQTSTWSFQNDLEQWNGITQVSDGGKHILRLDLSNWNLDAELEQLAPYFASMIHLKSLKARKNRNFTGSLGSLDGLLPNLEDLDLSSTGIDGELSDVQDFSMLRQLRLSNTRVSGTLACPLVLRSTLICDGTGMLSGVAQLLGLKILMLGETHVQGTLSDISNLDLTTLGLSSTDIDGSIVDLSTMEHLGMVQLNSTRVGGV